MCFMTWNKQQTHMKPIFKATDNINDFERPFFLSTNISTHPQLVTMVLPVLMTGGQVSA